MVRIARTAPLDQAVAQRCWLRTGSCAEGRRLCADEQATQQIGFFGAYCNEGGSPADVLADSRAETQVIDHGTAR